MVPASQPDAVGHGSTATNVGALVWLLAFVALALRLGMGAFLGDVTGFDTATRADRGVTWDWGYEQGAIGQALAEGRGFADPFGRGAGGVGEGTGPTGWCAPLYPLLLAGLIEATGGITRDTAWALAVLQALAAALVVPALLRLGRAVDSTLLGLAAGALWTFHPLAAYLPVALVWDSTFVALGLVWALARVAEAGPAASPRRVVGHGAAFGLLALVNPAPLALVPVLVLYWWRGRAARDGVRVAAAFCGGLALVAGPWAARNLLVLGSPELRTNFGVELFVGNNDGARGPFNGRLHPAYNEAELARYEELGEVAYARDCRGRALAWAQANPAAVLRLTAERVQRFWVGPRPWEPTILGSGERRHRDWQGWIEWLAHAGFGLSALVGAVLMRGRPGGALLLRGALVLFPLVYYVTHVFERYRFPLEPLIVLCAAACVLRVTRALHMRAREVERRG